MFCTVDANQDQLIFDGKRWGFASIERHANLTREEFLDREPAWKIAQREIVVQFHEQLRLRPTEKILAWDFAGVDGAKRNLRTVTRGDHQLRGATNVALANEKIEVAIATHSGITVSLNREHWPFHDQRFDF